MDLAAFFQRVLGSLALENVGHTCALPECAGVSVSRCERCARRACLKHCVFSLSLLPKPRAVPLCPYCVLSQHPDLFRDFDGERREHREQHGEPRSDGDVVDAEFDVG